MPMDIEGALWAYAHKDEYPDMGRRAEAAIREAFEVRDNIRKRLEKLVALAEADSARARILSTDATAATLRGDTGAAHGASLLADAAATSAGHWARDAALLKCLLEGEAKPDDR